MKTLLARMRLYGARSHKFWNIPVHCTPIGNDMRPLGFFPFARHSRILLLRSINWGAYHGNPYHYSHFVHVDQSWCFYPSGHQDAE
jgi:hypothetical protein